MNGIASGSHDLRIELSGYNSLTNSFDILPATTTIAEFRLIPFGNQFLKRDPPRSQPYERNTDNWGSPLSKPEDRWCRH
jgi:hypothetical protein